MYVLGIEDKRDATSSLYDFLEAKGNVVDTLWQGRVLTRRYAGYLEVQ